jgi:hypothetical protein
MATLDEIKALIEAQNETQERWHEDHSKQHDRINQHVGELYGRTDELITCGAVLRTEFNGHVHETETAQVRVRALVSPWYNYGVGVVIGAIGALVVGIVILLVQAGLL